MLLAHALRRERIYLYGHPEQELSEIEWIHYGRYLHERLTGKPTQYITGRQEFYGREFRVTPDVLIPRPETEHVVEAALELAGGARRIWMSARGPGALAVTLQLEMERRRRGTDISPAALRVAAENAGAAGRARWISWLAILRPRSPSGSMDMVVSNPPYVPLVDADGLQREVRDYEPHVALFGGHIGLRDLRTADRGCRASAASGRLADRRTGLRRARAGPRDAG